MPLSASAPAKLIFLGEYAVLEEAPALVAAIDCRAYVTLRGASTSNWWLSAPELGIRELALDEHGELPGTLDGSTRDSLTLFDAVRRTVADSIARPGPLAIHIDTASFFSDGRKLGLGSSAAVAVALTMALSAAAGEAPERETVLRLASEAHRRAQGGIGSNTDIAAAVYGGVLSYRTGQTPVAVTLPPRLWLQPVLLDRSASTTELVGKVLDLKEHSPQRFQAVMRPLQQLAEQGYSAFAEHDEVAFLHAFSAYHDALEQLGDAAGADIVSAAHRALHSATRDTGICYKSCGAGGGDIGLLAASNTQQDNDGLARRITHTTGYRLLEAALGAAGVRIEHAH